MKLLSNEVVMLDASGEIFVKTGTFVGEDWVKESGVSVRVLLEMIVGTSVDKVLTVLGISFDVADAAEVFELSDIPVAVMAELVCVLRTSVGGASMSVGSIGMIVTSSFALKFFVL